MVSSLIAGWSSPVARQAHNLKAAGSNPALLTPPSPQTKESPVIISLNARRLLPATSRYAGGLNGSVSSAASSNGVWFSEQNE